MSATTESIEREVEEEPSAPSTRVDTEKDDEAPHVLSIALSLRRKRVAIVVVAIITLLGIFTGLMWSGRKIDEFDSGTVTPDERTALLDRYNSYSGNAASVVGRPLEFAVVIVAQVIVLWCMSDSVMSTITKRRVQVAILVVSGMLGFLLTNALNALNVQLREGQAELVMSSSDLTNNASFVNSSTMEYSFSEHTPHNPTANTILRTLVAPRTAASRLKCQDRVFGIPDDSIAFGIPQRAWMSNLITAALPTQTVRIDLQSNSTTSSPHDFPMNASTAVDLLITGVSTHRDYTPFAVVTPFVLPVDYKKWYPPTANVRAARLTGLISANPDATETENRETFLSKIALFARLVTAPEYQRRTILRRWTMDLTRVNITPAMSLDAVTIEMEIAIGSPSATFTDKNGTSYTSTVAFSSSPIHISENVAGLASSPRMDAFASCMNQEGTDALRMFVSNGSRPEESAILCENISTTSLLVISTSSYFKAASLADYTFVNKSGVFKSGDRLHTTIANFSAVSSVTFARLNWQPQNLAKAHEARCDDEHGCSGVEAPLLETNQRLLVSTKDIPLDLLSPIDYNNNNYFPVQQPFELVSMRRATKASTMMFNMSWVKAKDPSGISTYSENSTDPERKDYAGVETAGYVMFMGEVLLPHNIQNINVVTSTPLPNNCSASVDRRTQNYVNNHLYMENTLQATYTAAAFFVLQNGAVRDVIPTESVEPIQLKLDHNILKTVVWVSVPRLNAVITIVGCGLLIAILAVAIVRPDLTMESTPWRTDQHQVARVIVDEATFPPALLKRLIDDGNKSHDVEQLAITEIVVTPTV